MTDVHRLEHAIPTPDMAGEWSARYQPERELLVAVIAKAIDDATRPFGRKRDVGFGVNAIDFLFRTDAPGLRHYTEWLGMDVEQFRSALLARIYIPGAGFTAEQRSAFREHYRAWKQGETAREVFDDDEE